VVANRRKLSPWKLAVAALVAGGGAYLGYTFGAGAGSTGMTAWFGAMVALALAVLILIVLGVTAALIRFKSTNSDPALRSVIRTGALFLAGTGVGWALSRAFAFA
jgi:uncharacterized membrane protein